jgi:hypothetical protein
MAHGISIGKIRKILNPVKAAVFASNDYEESQLNEVMVAWHVLLLVTQN